MNRETLILIVTIILAAAGLYYLYKYKKETLWGIACYVVARAEDEFISGEGKKKLEYAIKEFKKKTPGYLSWLISEKFIISQIEEALKTLRKGFKDTRDKQLSIINEMLKIAPTGVQNDLFEIAGQMKKEIDSRGYIEAFLEGRTDFRNNSNIVGGVKAGFIF